MFTFEHKKGSSMRLKKIHLNNFLSHQDTDIIFDQEEPYLIMGSNGAGKSTIIEAIGWCLYGDIMRINDVDSVITESVGKDCWVTLWLADDTDEFKIVRGRNVESKNFIRIEHNSVVHEFNRLADGQEEIDRLFGDCRLFLNTVMFGQGLNKFFANTKMVKEEERKKVLECVIGMDDFKTFQKRAMIKYTKYEALLTSLLNQKSELESLIQKYEGMKSFIVIDNKKELEEQFKKEENRKLQLETTIDSYKQLLPQCLKNKTELNILLSKLQSKLLLTKHEYSNVLKNITNLKDEIHKHKEWESDPGSVIKTGTVCPSCYRVIDTLSLDGFIIYVKNRLVTLLSELKEVICNCEHYESEVAQLEIECEDCKEKWSNYANEEMKINQNVYSYTRSLEICNENIISLENKLKQDGNINTIEYVKGLMSEAQVKLVAINSDVDKYTHLKEVYSFWVEAFSDRGMKNMVFNEIFPLFNQRINTYLDKLALSLIQVKASTTSLTKKEKERDKISVTVYICDRIQPYDRCSGGEQRKIDLAIMFALRDLSIASSGKGKYFLDIMLFDEVADWLDNCSIACLTEILNEFAEFSTIIVISHNDELKDYFQNRLIVTKNNIIGSVVSNEGDI